MMLNIIFLIYLNLISIVKSDRIETFNYNNKPDDLKNFKCFDKSETDEYRNIFNSGYKDQIGIQVSDRITHQLLSRIFGIYLREILGYQNVFLSPMKINDKYKSEEKYKLYKTLDSLVHQWPIPIIDLEVWMYPDYRAIPSLISEAGLSLDPGRFGWFVPKDFIKLGSNIDNDYYQRLHFDVFTDPTSKFYQNYVINETILDEMELKFGKFHKLIPEQCENIKCVTLLAEYDKDTSFIQYQLNDEKTFKFYVNVIWLNDNYRNAIDWLYKKYNDTSELRKLNKNFILLHWTPSDIIDADIKYEIITMPKCELMTSSSNTLCKYEMIPILKYFDKKFQNFRNGFHTLFEFYLSRDELRPLLIKSNLARKLSTNNNELYMKLNQISCDWLKLNKHQYKDSIKMNNVNITIGGIFPYSGSARAYGNILSVVDHAIQSINDNKYILPGYNLSVSKNDGACRADTVMKAFIHYCSLNSMIETPVIGVLGPACSETVEPIAGISKHTKMTVISYSAEGAIFTDRDTYPYFFRTIGSNRQYEQVYLDLFKQLKWHRVAALTEDGQKYTEYLSHMETIMKLENMELIDNKKFTKDVTKAGMRRLLLELKNKQAKIIIADIYNDNAQLVMCEAYHLQMTAKNGYVWFLPVWLPKTWMIEPNNKQILNCTQEQLYETINGHFSLNHAPYASNSSIIDYENKTVGNWLKEFDSTDISSYAGFVHDAIWVYALATDKLLRNDSTAINSLRSPEIVQKLVDIIWKTDFNGLSGRIRFDGGGSRINDIIVMQWVNNKFHQIGKYVPNIVEDDKVKINGGNLQLNESLIHWFTENRPTDGTFICQFAVLAEILNTSCDNVLIYLTSLFCLILVAIISLASFMFWKHQYHTKIKRTAKVMRNFGIDLLSPNQQTVNTLDKWEVPKDKIVINRRLGEGAFGTVYGGEAQLSDCGWTAVAVKTLKMGASQEDRLDFLSEAEAMKRFDHKNIVQFLGVCLKTEPIYTIMEFMLYGDLKTYLLARRHLVNEKVTDDSDISPKRLTMYALDVARGLSYLAEEKYVHRDIACRNCLVNTQRAVKIGDFGMARPIYDNDYYRFNRKGMLPVRWMAPESLGLGVFTPASDVWSYGILLYEIITFGSFPYQGLTNYEALEYINRGETLCVPPGTKPHLEALMKACWSQEKKKRPSASEIFEYISNNPRLLTPCLDVPLSSVQMGETDSDQLEILPGLRKRIATQTDINLLTSASHINNFDQSNDFNNDSSQRSILQTANIPFIETQNSSTIDINRASSLPPDSNSNDESNINSYSPMSPLLKINPEITISSSSLRRYVPMHGVQTQNKLLNNTNNCNIIGLTFNGGNLINKQNENESDYVQPKERVSIF